MYKFKFGPKCSSHRPEGIADAFLSFGKCGLYILACKVTNFFLFHNETGSFFEKKS